ncbi:MAG: hypothetical protein GEU81_10155 [Nitriliruptorales bacterium]|nr:hypothetical protein [Nitriliruptorales bacterium]
MDSLLHWVSEPPALRRPMLLVSLEGFVDAGAAAGTASMFLRHRWQAEPAGTFDGDAFIDYRARRPTAVVDSGELRRVDWPGLELLVAHVDGPRDVVLLLGPEPDMRWRAFTREVVEASQKLGIEASIGFGAYPAAVPHTRPTRIMQASNTAMPRLALDLPSIPGYTGPIGAGTILQAALGEAGIPATGLWAEVPHYIATSPYPAAALALVRAFADAVQTAVETTELEAAAKLHREQLDDAVAEHEEATAMIAAFEQHLDSGEADEELPSGEDLAAEIERFLRAQPD